MKKLQLSHKLLILFFLLSLVVIVFAEDPKTPTLDRTPIKNPPKIDDNRPDRPTRPPQQPRENQREPKEEDSDKKTPDIPKAWGELVSSQFLMDGAYLTFTFKGNNGVIRVATFKKNAKSGSVDLYNLMIFNRTDKNDLKPISEE